MDFAASKEFDFRSESLQMLQSLEKSLEKDGLKEHCSEALETLRKAVNLEKRECIALTKDEIMPLLEEEIAVRYYFQTAGVEVRLRYDRQLSEALETFKKSADILSGK